LRLIRGGDGPLDGIDRVREPERHADSLDSRGADASLDVCIGEGWVAAQSPATTRDAEPRGAGPKKAESETTDREDDNDC
jgi:hypothetical protein